jgi:hypothetical protein
VRSTASLRFATRGVGSMLSGARSSGPRQPGVDPFDARVATLVVDDLRTRAVGGLRFALELSSVTTEV